MKLSFEQRMVCDSVAEELGFAEFLALFDLDVPMIPHRVLRPLAGEDGAAHFARLRTLTRLAAEKKLDPAALAARIGRLPSLDTVLPHFAVGRLEQYHLFTLGLFLTENRSLLDLEENLHSGEAACCAGMAHILTQFMEPGFTGLLFTADERRLRQEIEDAQREVSQGLARYEAEILGRTGLSMIYPYPKELAPDTENLAQLTGCGLIAVTDRDNLHYVDYRLPSTLSQKIAARDRLTALFAEWMTAKLALINRRLAPYYPEFAAWYENRKEEVYCYALLRVQHLHGFCLPDFQDASGCRLTRAVLPAVERRVPAYVPLDIELRPGADLLFGANMSGKTTVLKTLYFHLTLIRAGLPVPAGEVLLHFPEEIDLHLKSSGDLRQNVSGFEEEIRFFCRPRRPKAYILVDELFHSTDPVSGATLSAVILSEYAESDTVFVCTSHYSEVLYEQGIHLFRMKDGHDDGAASSPPYGVEPIPPDGIGEALRQGRRALELALTFPLPDSVREKVRLHLTKN